MVLAFSVSRPGYQEPHNLDRDPPTLTNHGPEILFLKLVTKMETQYGYRDRGTSLVMVNS